MSDLMSGEGIADTQGPNASLDFGQAAQMQREAGALKNTSPGAYAATQLQTGPNQQLPGASTGAAAQQGGAGVTSPAPPVSATQPSPQQSLLKVQHPVLSPRPQAPPSPWRDELQNWANHPLAGPYLKALAKMANEK